MPKPARPKIANMKNTKLKTQNLIASADCIRRCSVGFSHRVGPSLLTLSSDPLFGHSLLTLSFDHFYHRHPLHSAPPGNSSGHSSGFATPRVTPRATLRGQHGSRRLRVRPPRHLPAGALQRCQDLLHRDRRAELHLRRQPANARGQEHHPRPAVLLRPLPEEGRGGLRALPAGQRGDGGRQDEGSPRVPPEAQGGHHADESGRRHPHPGRPGLPAVPRPSRGDRCHERMVRQPPPAHEPGGLQAHPRRLPHHHHAVLQAHRRQGHQGLCRSPGKAPG